MKRAELRELICGLSVDYGLESADSVLLEYDLKGPVVMAHALAAALWVKRVFNGSATIDSLRHQLAYLYTNGKFDLED